MLEFWILGLGQVGLGGATGDLALVFSGYVAVFFQIIGQVGYAAYKIAVVGRICGAGGYQVADGATAGEPDIGRARVATVYDNGGAQVRCGTLVFIVGQAVAVCVSFAHDIEHQAVMVGGSQWRGRVVGGAVVGVCIGPGVLHAGDLFVQAFRCQHVVQRVAVAVEDEGITLFLRQAVGADVHVWIHQINSRL